MITNIAHCYVYTLLGMSDNRRLQARASLGSAQVTNWNSAILFSTIIIILR